MEDSRTESRRSCKFMAREGRGDGFSGVSIMFRRSLFSYVANIVFRISILDSLRRRHV